MCAHSFTMPKASLVSQTDGYANCNISCFPKNILHLPFKSAASQNLRKNIWFLACYFSEAEAYQISQLVFSQGSGDSQLSNNKDVILKSVILLVVTGKKILCKIIKYQLVIDFLTELYFQGLGNSSTNSARCAISTSLVN